MASPTQQNGGDVFRGIDTAGLPWRILLFSGIVFGLSLFIYFGFRFGYESYLDSRSETLDQKIQELASQISQEDQQNLISFYSQLVNLRTVLEKHQFIVKSFDFLDKYTLPTVYYSGAKIMGVDRVIELSGGAKSMDDFIEQLAVFDAAPEFDEKAIVENVQFSNQEVGFSIILHMSADALKKL
jgi:hypothetical protein